jgi:hypothetical protein
VPGHYHANRDSEDIQNSVLKKTGATRIIGAVKDVYDCEIT